MKLEGNYINLVYLLFHPAFLATPTN